jgi:hypothetical protein
LSHGDQISIQGRCFGIKRPIQIGGDLLFAALIGGYQAGHVPQVEMASHEEPMDRFGIPVDGRIAYIGIWY